MDSLDLHPEELFDKAARGTASPEELTRIDAHLASCATCRFERQVRADFDAVHASEGDLDDLVARAMSGVVAQASEPVAVNGPPRRRRFTPLLVAAVALMGLTSLAAVGQFTGVLPKVLERLTTNHERTSTPPPAPAPRSSKPAPVSEVVPVEVPKPPETVVEIAEAAVPTPTPAPVVAQPVRPRPARPVEPSVAPGGSNGGAQSVVTPSETPEIPRAVTPPAPVVVEPDALGLFTRAQRERVQGDTAAAIRDFRSLIARYPGAKEAALAHAELGRLLLDRGEPVSALESFDAYLASHDTVLREDVLGGRALSLQKLGRVEAERAAWELVLREYPSGVYAPRARSRLESLAP